MSEQLSAEMPKIMPDIMANIMHGDGLFARLPGWVIDTLSTEQKEAIYQAADQNTWSAHPVNIRLSLPFIRRRYYLTIVAGEEKRSLDRRSADRNRYPLRKIANLFFFVGLASVFYIIAIFALAVNTALVEF